MPGTSTSGTNRLRAWGAAVVTGVVAVLAIPAVAWSAPLPAAETVTVSAGQGSVVVADAAPTSPAELGSPLPAAPQGPAAASAGSGQGAAVVSGQAAGIAADLSVDSVAAPPAAVPWIVGALVVLVVAGAARAYDRSPQRAALRERRAAQP